MILILCSLTMSFHSPDPLTDFHWFSLIKTTSANLNKLHQDSLIQMGETWYIKYPYPFKDGRVGTKLMICSKLLIWWTLNNT